MPYKLRGNSVVKIEPDGYKLVKRHPTRRAALAHLRALYANVKDVKKK